MAADFPVVFALYPHVTQLDFTGPHEVFARLPISWPLSAKASASSATPMVRTSSSSTGGPRGGTIASPTSFPIWSEPRLMRS